MNDLPKGWAETNLGQITRHRREKCDPSSVPEASFIGLEDIEAHTSRILRVGKASEVRSQVSVFKEGDVLYSRLRPYLNKVVVAPFDGVASAEVLAIVPNEVTIADFVMQRIKMQDFLNFTALLDKGDRPRVSFDEIATFPVILPPLAEQKRIVAKLDTLTSSTVRARAALNKIPALVEKYKSRILDMAFSGELTKDLRLKPSNKKVDVTDLPTGWEIKLLEDISEIQGGIQVGKKRRFSSDLVSVPYLRVANVQRGWLKLNEIKTIEVTHLEKERLLLREGDILMNEGGDRDKLGRGWVWEGQISDCIHQNHVFRIRLKDCSFPSKFVSHYANEKGQRYFFEQGTQTTNLASVSKQKIATLPIPVPPRDEAVEIVRRIESTFAWLDRVSVEYAAASKQIAVLEASIFQAAFRGRIVRQDPNDETALMLLNRVETERNSVQAKSKSRRKTATRSQKSVKVGERMENLIDVLKVNGNWVSASEAAQALGVGNGSPSDAVERFYNELREHLQNGLVEVERRGHEDWLRLTSVSKR
ncbi:MAG: type I restriction endonuclease subunit S [Rhodospirillales bacterium]|nr:type I restriction endonuclease subunit S [Rhodospirillales bacterium]